MSGVFDRRPGVAAPGDGAVAAGRDIGTAVTGPNGVGTQHFGDVTVLLPPAFGAVPPAASVDAPHGLTNLPERPGLFVGRARELARLAAGAEGAHVLHGLGGVGKSTLAAHWAAEHATHTPVWWIHADNRASVDAGLCALATAVAPGLAGFVQESQLRDWALQWLASHQGWLIVLDNVSDPGDVKPLLAAVPRGRFLITSRRSTGWHGVAETISLEVLAADEAVDLFTRIAPEAGDRVSGLCAELGCLPLAVEQAAAYCLETGTTADDYLTLLAAYPADMYTAAIEGGDPERTVARVWRVTLDRLADDPLAVTILLTVAWYAPDGIPRSLLDGLGTPPAVRRAIGRLAAHSMVTLHGTSAISLHRLVQAVSRTPDPDDPHRRADAVEAARDLAAECLVEAVPADAEDPSTWSAWRRLLPHVEALAGHTDPQADTVSLARVFGRAGEFAAGQGLRGRAGQLVERSESAIVRHLGPEHPLALVARNRVIAMDPLPEAEMREHITRCERVLGPRHPETITAWFESAASHMRAGDFEGVERVVEHVVKMRRRVLGPGHAHTLRARWTLLLAKSMQAGLDGLAPEIELLMADCVRDLGERHPLTLDVRLMWHSRNKIGTDLIKPLYSAVRASEEEREDILREALERTRQKVDPEAMREWAREALPEAERHVADCEEALGPEHSDTVWARLNLVQAYLVAEDFDNALRHARQAAADAEQQRRSGADAAPSVMAHLLMMFTSAVARDESAVTDAIGWFRSASEQFGDDSGGPLGPDVIEQMERFMAALMNREGAGETNREGAGETNREGAGEMNREGAEEGTS